MPQPSSRVCAGVRALPNGTYTHVASSEAGARQVVQTIDVTEGTADAPPTSTQDLRGKKVAILGCFTHRDKLDYMNDSTTALATI